MLFSDSDSPFITILAVDPHVIIKGIEHNLSGIFRDSSISGHDYLRNIVHLPFYLQSQTLPRPQSQTLPRPQGEREGSVTAQGVSDNTASQLAHQVRYSTTLYRPHKYNPIGFCLEFMKGPNNEKCVENS